MILGEVDWQIKVNHGKERLWLFGAPPLSSALPAPDGCCPRTRQIMIPLQQQTKWTLTLVHSQVYHWGNRNGLDHCSADRSFCARVTFSIQRKLFLHAELTSVYAVRDGDVDDECAVYNPAHLASQGWRLLVGVCQMVRAQAPPSSPSPSSSTSLILFTIALVFIVIVTIVSIFRCYKC